MTEFRLGEFFCGPGGLALGALTSDVPGMNISHAWATDYDRSTCDTYIRNICPENPDSVICNDIRTLDFEKLRALGEIDGFAFGFPCNDYSTVGEQKGMAGNYGPLYAYGVKALKLFQPKWFLAENVSGLNSANDGDSFKQILRELKECGYRVCSHLYKFEEYGLPQARHRIIIVGIRNDLNLNFLVPSPEGYKLKTSKEAIEVPPIAPDAFNHEKTKQSERVVERLKHIKAGENAFTAQLPAHLKLNVKGATISQIYRRLDPNRPAYTVTGSGGGGTHMYHWAEPRALTNRERARLQTFPDTYQFCGTKESVRKQIGMAVPPEGARIIFEAILKTFAGIEYPSLQDSVVQSIKLEDTYDLFEL